MLLGENKEKDWKIINYRSVGDMVTAEYLHDLYNQAVIELNPVHFRNTVCVVEDGMFKSFAPQKEWDYLARVLGDDLIRNKKLREKFSKYLERPQKDLTNLMVDLKNKYSSGDTSPKDAFYDLKELHFLALDRIYAINLVQFEHALGYALEKLAKEENVDIDKILKSEKLTVSGQEELKSLELSLKVSEGEIALLEAISLHEKEFGAVNLAYGAKHDDSKNNSSNRLKNLLKLSIEKREERLEELKTPLKQEVFDYDLRLKEIADLAKKMGERRDENKALMGRVASVRTGIMDKISFLGSVDRDELNSYFLEDIYNLLVNGKKLDEQELEKRSERIVLQRQEREVYGAEALSISEKVFPKVDFDKDLNGIVASSGVVRGRVRHVYSKEDAEQVTNDEILVAFGTDFDLMVGLQNCAGVITEEGGLLSHASVISRELSKPCLIDVKNAMQMLNDGDTVEVNTKEGKINIIERFDPIIEESGKLKFFDEVSAYEIEGSKASNLYKVMVCGSPVLPSLEIKIDDGDDIEELAREIIAAFAKRGIKPNSFIARSNDDNEDTKDKSMAGQFDSPECQAEAKLLAKAIRKVLESYKNPKTKGIGVKFSGKNKVLIHPYYPQKFGGVAFSHHPVTGEKDLVVESSEFGSRAAVEGQGEAPKEIMAELEVEMERIGKKFKCPVDVEWGYGDFGLKIFQARPIILKKKLILIAGGKGSRIKRIFNQESAPRFTKHFLPLPEEGGTIIGAAIEKSKKYFDEIEISSSENTSGFIGANFKGKEKISIVEDFNMIGPLCPPFLELLAKGKRVFAYTGDAYSNFSWKEMEDFHDDHGKPVTLLTAKSFPIEKGACFCLDKKGIITGWKRKAKSTKDDFINIGGYIIDPDPKVVKIAQELIDLKTCKEDLFFKRCIEEGVLAGYRDKGFSCNINTPEVYNKLVEKLLTDREQRVISSSKQFSV